MCAYAHVYVCACVCVHVCVCVRERECVCVGEREREKERERETCATSACTAADFLRETRGGGLGSRPKKMYGERLGDGVEYHLMKPTPRR